MTDAERKKRIRELLAELKDLQAVPRSDWHAGFEALLRMEAHRFGDRVQIKTEHLLGEEPPRADFVVLIDQEGLLSDKAVFRIFRKFNVVEFKNRHDALNERVLRKGCGYVNLYIGTAEHEGDVPSDQVTLSIFRASKPEKLFREMRERGQLTEDSVKGIYHAEGIMDIPFQIVITSELEGPDYAAYRALTDHASGADVKQIIQAGSLETDSTMQAHYRTFLALIARKNPDTIEELRRDQTMEREWTDIFKDVIDERVKHGRQQGLQQGIQQGMQQGMQQGRQQGRQETLLESIRNVMESFGVSEERAMEALKIPQSQRAAYAELVKRA